MRRHLFAFAVPISAAGLSLGLAVGLVSCGGGGGGGTSAVVQAPFGLTNRVVVTGLSFPSSNPQPSAVQLVRAFPGLTLQSPVLLTSPLCGEDRIFIVEQAGKILVFENDDSITQASTFLDITGKVQSGGEEGLLGLAFDPDFCTSGHFYVYYSAGSPRRSVISRFSVSQGNPNQADPASESIVLEVAQPFGNHNGGMIAFGPDGYLYIALGDGGSGGDPLGNGQDLTSLPGSILRIDPSTGAPYAIPSDNPFVGQGGGVKEEIWAYGLRNPYRFSFDRQTGTLWAGDVGQSSREEVDIVTRGGNYGWNVFEGDLEFSNPNSLPASNFEAPVIDYDRSLGGSVIGGHVYRGSRFASLRGSYFYADFLSGRIWALVHNGSTVVSNTEVAQGSNISSFGEDQDGELYVVQISGEVFRIEDGGQQGSSGEFPSLLSQTGLFEDTADLVPAAGLIEYDLVAPLWSDGTRKSRWLALPGTSQIEFHPTEAWSFPTGTVIVKHFELDLTVGQPSTARRLETRVLVNEEIGWAGYTYRWNDAQTDAELLPGAQSETLTVQDASAPGGQRQQTYDYPSSTDCRRCHTQAAGFVLGPRTRQLNRDFDYSSATDNQLRTLNHIQFFTTDIGSHTSYGALTDPEADTAAIASRARSYLASNCTSCHRPGGPTPVTLDLRPDVALSGTNTVGIRPSSGDLGLADAFIVKPGAKESSVLWERLRRLDTTRMPPLASNEVDEMGVSIVGDWIDAGPD